MAKDNMGYHFQLHKTARDVIYAVFFRQDNTMGINKLA